MNRLSRRLARAQSRPTPSRPRRQSIGAGLVALCGLVYGLAGFLLTALPPQPWLWPVALVALLLHLGAIAAQASAASRRWLTTLGAGLLHLLGAVGLTLSLAVAMNYLGSDQLDDITVIGAAGEVILFSLLAVGLTLVCRWTTAQLSRHLLKRFSRRRQTGVLVMIGLGGLVLGGTLGLLTA